MSVHRYGLIALGAAAIAALFGSQITALEGITRSGDTVLLDLRPVDPRALMMGDFMALRYVEEISSEIPKEIAPSGTFVLALDENKVGTFDRVFEGNNLAANEVLINYIRRRRGVTFGAPRYYFQNGTAETFEAGDYGIFKVSPEGRAILAGLADENFQEILPPSE